jgi:hypothetical protein
MNKNLFVSPIYGIVPVAQRRRAAMDSRKILG